MRKLDSYCSKVVEVISMYSGDNFAIHAHIIPILEEVYDIGLADGYAAEFYEDCYCDDTPNYDDYQEEYPDPMESAEAAFAYIEEEEIESWYRDLSEYDDTELAETQDAEEIESWANTAHDDMNQDLKDALTTLNNIRITKAIWSAREHMMSKIVFDNDDVYPIHHISFDVDENGIPVDICITTRWQYLEYIAANHCQLGYNCNDEEQYGFYEGLFGRLDSFRVFDYEGNLLWQFDPTATHTYRF